MYALVARSGLTRPEIAIRFLLSEPRIHTVLMGARSVEEVDANVDASERGPLDASLHAEFDAIAALVPFRPHDEPFALRFGRAYTGTPAAGPV